MIPLSLYIHFPWCIQKCPYCDFNSHTLKSDLPEQEYISALINDLMHDLPAVKHRKVHSIFMGGGTPSLFSPTSISQLLTAIRQNIDFEDEEIEITLEANPGAIEQEKFVGFRQAGINRLSIGVQSFQTHKLTKLGRIHDDNAAKRAATAAVAAGFSNFNLDLMHGLPEQTPEDAIFDLQTAIGFAPPHLSWYQLTLEPNTLFYHQPPVLPRDDSLQQIQTQGHHLLLNNHYQHYEVSAYCREGHQCHHNLNYWKFGDYLGIGAGAHAKMTNTQTGEITRLSKIKHPRDYLSANNYIATKEIVEKKQLAFEFMLNALRLQQSIAWTLLEERSGLTSQDILGPLARCQQRGLMCVDKQQFTLTDLGRCFLNDVLTEFIP
jgi:putative oxygen-independent coproporphyrinogen III oxidase